MTGEQYDFGYSDNNVYGRAVTLITDLRLASGEVHLDLGCGFGAIAEQIAGLGLGYVGADIQGPGTASLRARGFEAVSIDLHEVDRIRAAIDEALAGRSLASISILDTLEHLTTGRQVLEVLQDLAQEHGGAPLIVSVPNVSHRDVGAKLLVGRWDYTETGLLDRTHLVHHTNAFLTEMVEQAGWRQIGAADFTMRRSDQFFPADLPVLGKTTVVGSYLSNLADATNPFATTQQFVRAYQPGRAPKAANPDDGPRPFLTVLMRTQGTRAEQMRDALSCLVGQVNQNFELIVLPHKVTVEQQISVEQVILELPPNVRSRTRMVLVDDGGRSRPLNAGVALARGRYVAVLDDDDLVLGNWVDTFAVLAHRGGGRVLRSICVTQGITAVPWAGGQPAGHRTLTAAERRYSPEFDLVEHLIENQSPLMSLAFPTTLFADFGMRFDESLDVMEDWDMLLRSALLCGVESAPTITAVYRLWTQGDSSYSLHEPAHWLRTQRHILERLDSQSHLWPPGTMSRLIAGMPGGLTAPGVRPIDARRQQRLQSHQPGADERAVALVPGTYVPTSTTGRVIRFAARAGRAALRRLR
ncbi:MAG: hypothetical protein V9F04_11425 [Dermatophilaceae bacterium]